MSHGINNLADSLRASAERFPRREAIIDGTRRMTYESLHELSLRFGGVLREFDVQRGDNVAFLLPNVPEFTVCYFGCHAAGAVVVPLNVLLKSDEIAYHLDDSDAIAVVVFESLLEQAGPAVERVPGCRHLIVVSSGAGPCQRADGPSTIDYGVAMEAEPIVDESPSSADDTAVILYTSGTTGQPKGAEMTHDNLLRNAHYVATRITPIDETSRCLVCLPLFHSFGQTVQQNAHVASGGVMVFLPRFDAAVALALMQEHQVSYFAGVPTMYFAILESPASEGFDPAALRYCLSGGAPMPVEVMLKFNERFSATILEGYGLSETSPVASFNTLDRSQKPGSVGRPIEGVEFRLVDGDGETVNEPDVPGEIWIKGHNVMKRYYGKPEETAEALQDGWFRSGDVATVDHDGDDFIVDRIKDVILRGGYNVYPREVEEVLYTHPAVTEAAVIGVPDERLGEEVVAFVACREQVVVEPEDLVAHCKRRLAAFKYPRHVRILDSLPKGPTGKILRRALRDG